MTSPRHGVTPDVAAASEASFAVAYRRALRSLATKDGSAAAVTEDELLERNVTRIDLRMPDRVTVRRVPAPKGAGDKGV